MVGHWLSERLLLSVDRLHELSVDRCGGPFRGLFLWDDRLSVRAAEISRVIGESVRDVHGFFAARGIFLKASTATARARPSSKAAKSARSGVRTRAQSASPVATSIPRAVARTSSGNKPSEALRGCPAS